MQILEIAFVMLSVAWVAIVVLEACGISMRLRFTIRDLLWLTVVVALAVAWGMTLAENRRLRDNEIVIPTSIRDASVEKAMQMDRAW